MIYISSCDIITINARTSRQHWLGKALLRFWPALTPQFSSESGHNDGGIQLQKPPYPFVGSKTKTWAKLAQCSFLSLTFLMLSLLWQRETFFSFQKSKTFNSFNKQLYAWASTHCWANRERKKQRLLWNKADALFYLVFSFLIVALALEKALIPEIWDPITPPPFFIAKVF